MQSTASQKEPSLLPLFKAHFFYEASGPTPSPTHALLQTANVVLPIRMMDYISHHPFPLAMLAAADGSCSRTTSGGYHVGYTYPTVPKLTYV